MKIIFICHLNTALCLFQVCGTRYSCVQTWLCSSWSRLRISLPNRKGFQGQNGYVTLYLFLLFSLFLGGGWGLVSGALWNQIFLCSNLALFILIPFAYLFTESEGFPGSKRVRKPLFIFIIFFFFRGGGGGPGPRGNQIFLCSNLALFILIPFASEMGRFRHIRFRFRFRWL